MAAAAMTRLRHAIGGARSVAGEIAGLGLFTVAGFTIDLTIGFVVAGVACFTLNWMART
jgi:hypothetical protein